MKKTLLVSLSATLLLPGCQKDDIRNNRQDGEKVHVTANLSQGILTKVDVEPAEKGANVYWIDGDQVSVFGNAAYAGSLSTKLGERAKKASFIGDIIENAANNYYVVYPWNSNHESAYPESYLLLYTAKEFDSGTVKVTRIVFVPGSALRFAKKNVKFEKYVVPGTTDRVIRKIIFCGNAGYLFYPEYICKIELSKVQL